MVVTLLDPDRENFLFWAGFLILLWWLVNNQRRRPWTTNNILRAAIYLLYLMAVLVLAVLIGSFPALLLFIELALLISVSVLWGARATRDPDNPYNW